MAAAADLATLALDDLRSRRASARRAAELAHLRGRQGGSPGPEELVALDAEVVALTEELIRRYAANLALVDSLLQPAYPAKVTTRGEARA